ncbi:MAG: 8-amino-7-oxononanoate synthase, partial [Alphaproteobacteria bacterium]
MSRDLLEKFAPLIAEREKLKAFEPDPLEVTMEQVLSPTEAIVNGRRTILAGTNNYMAMTFDPDAIAAAREALERFGTGTTGSRILNGTYVLHRRLEETLA